MPYQQWLLELRGELGGDVGLPVQSDLLLVLLQHLDALLVGVLHLPALVPFQGVGAHPLQLLHGSLG